MDPAKLKVVELRSQLQQRKLDTKGNKAVLVERLRKALEDETGDHVGETVPTDSHNESSGDPSSQDEREKTPEPTKPISPSKSAGRSPRSSSGGSPIKTTPTRGSPKIPTTPIIQKPMSPEKSPIIEEASEPVMETSVDTLTETSSIIDKDKIDESEQGEMQENKVIEPSITQISTPQDTEEPSEIKSTHDDESMDQFQPVTQTIDTNISENSSEIEEKQDEQPSTLVETTNDDINDEISEDNVEEKEEIENEHVDDMNDCTDTNADTNEEMETDEKDNQDCNDNDKKADAQSEESGGNGSTSDIKCDVELNTEITEGEGQIGELKNKSKMEIIAQDTSDLEDVDMKPTKQEHDGDKDSKDQDRRDRKERKRKRSTSSQDDRHKSPPPSKMDDEPEIDYSRVLLSWYDSDLNLIIDKSKFLSATPMHNDDFGYVWAGARASHGFTVGKIYYEVKITHECSVTLEGDDSPHVLRAGWSTASTSMHLAKDQLSYGYESTGKKSTGNNFSEYGVAFGLNDIIGCYLDMSDEENIVISYTMNGENLGEAFTVPKEELANKPLYPHILTKNFEFSCNFGDETPWNEQILEGFLPIGQVDQKDRVAGPQRPEKREDCEVIMMVGLPAAGKTVWANNYAAQNPDKMYNILGTSSLVNKIKVIGLTCLNKLLDVAATRRRNYILDQTNVYSSAQRRKMRHFYGFQRKAIVIVPTDEELKSRTAKREAIEGKEVPDSTVLEMKANFSAPVVGESFHTVQWVELDEEEAKKLIAKYNKEGKDAGFKQQQTNKRPRFESRSDSHRDNRDIRSSRNSRDSRDHRDRRSAYSDRNRNSTWRGGNHMGGGGGWRDRAPRGGGGSSGGAHMRHTSGGYGGSSGGWRGGRGGGQSLTPSHRGNDRRGSSNDRRSAISDSRSRSSASRQGGGWGPMNSNYHNSGHSSSGWGSSGSGGGGGGGSGGQSGGSWSSQSQQQGSYSGNNSSGSWGQQQNWGNWKGYGQSNYNQSSYNQQGYGNGNWGGWNQQYYNQYWGGQQQSSQSGQSTGSSGQSAITSSGVSATPAASTTSTSSTYNTYPQAGWQGYTQSYYSTDSSNTSTQQQK